MPSDKTPRACSRTRQVTRLRDGSIAWMIGKSAADRHDPHDRLAIVDPNRVPTPCDSAVLRNILAIAQLRT